ncbi:MAG: CvpA family protein [Flavobacteriales bacterium]
MSILDIFIIIPIVWAGYQGFRKGFVLEVTKLLALAVGIYGAIKFSEPMHIWLMENTEWDEQWLPAIAFGLVFVILIVAVYFFGRMLDSMIKAVQLGIVNRLAGLALGVLKMGLILSGLLMLIQSVDKGEMFLTRDRKESSLTYEPALKFGSTVIPAVQESKLYQQVVANFNNLKEEEVESNEQ